MKKLLSLALIGALSLSLTACGNNSSKDNSSSKETTKKEEKKEPLNLTGTWKSDENEGTWMEATISDNVISIDWVTDEGKTNEKIIKSSINWNFSSISNCMWK